MLFSELHGRLILHLRERIQNGELTERSLARLTGISQPHMHNVLKGVRILSPDLADHVLRTFKLSILDLVDYEELARRAASRVTRERPFIFVPVLRSKIGPGNPPATEPDHQQRLPLPTALVEALVDPLAAILDTDPDMEGCFTPGETVLLERTDLARALPESNSLYYVAWNMEGLVRHIRLERGVIHLLAERDQDAGSSGVIVPLCEYELMDVILARIHRLPAFD